MRTVQETAALLRGFDRVLILTHVRPDGDTVGCAAALCAALRALGKTAWLLPNPGLTDTTAPYAMPYAAPEGFVPEKVFLERLPEIAKNAIGDACTGSNPRQPSQEEMEKLLKCCYYDTEVDF